MARGVTGGISTSGGSKDSERDCDNEVRGELMEGIAYGWKTSVF